MNKRWIFAVLVISSLTLAACQPSQAAATEAAPSTAAAQEVIVQGRIVPIDSIDLAFSVNGHVVEVLVHEGEMTAAGQVIARLGGQEARLTDLARAEQELAVAEQAIQAIQDSAGVNTAQAILDVINARKTVDSAQEKSDDLAAQSDPDEKEVEEASALLALATVQLRAAEDHAATMVEGVSPAVVTAANMRYETAAAALTAAQVALEALELRAPMAGTLVETDLQVGRFASAGQTVVTVADTSSWVIQTDDLTELEVVRVFEGESARLVLDALPENAMNAKVTHIAQRYEEKRGDVTYTVTLAITDPVDALRWGMTGQISFVESE
jgi:multidrug resistance efflux pump